MSHSPDLCFLLAEHVVRAHYDGLSPDAVDGAKKSILDTLGVILAAGGIEPASRAAAEFALEDGGAPESSVLGFGQKLPAVSAAFANGVMAHGLDYDDQTPWGQHSASSLLPAVFAVAERIVHRGGRVTGQQMITAVAIGQDLFNRMRRHVDWQKDWNFSTVMGVYSATIAAGYLMQLDRDQIINALGIASMQSCGSTAVINATGSNLRGIYAGFPARGAVTAALLAERGIGGVPTLFEGLHGVFGLYFGGRYERQALLEGLGREFTGGLTLYKRWPAVGTAHGHIHATIGLIVDHGIAPDEIHEIRAFVGDYHHLMSEPLEARRAPSTLVEAKFSLPFLIAVAAAQKDVRLADFGPAALKDPVVLSLAQRVVPVDDASLDWKLDMLPGRVEIVTRDGRRFTRVGDRLPGSVEAPMNWAELINKFEDCAACAAHAMPKSTVQAIHQAVSSLDDVDDATSFLRLLG
jgi:2-methylcitrate dehydratase PrpD